MKKIIKNNVEKEAMSLITNITYAQVDSWFGGTYRDLKMSVICPKVTPRHEKMPVIVWLCGGGFFRMDRDIWLPQLADLARRGFIIASPEYRTSNEVGYPGPLQDVKASIRYLRANAEKYCIDDNRVYIMGESAGGAYAMLCSVTNGRKEYDVGNYLDYSSDVQAAADFYGPVDFEQFQDLMQTFPAEEDAAARGACYFRTQVKEGSAIRYVDENTPPTIIFHGAEDELVPLEQSKSYYKRLQEAGIQSDLYIIEGAGHGDDLFYQENIYDIIADFFNACTSK